MAIEVIELKNRLDNNESLNLLDVREGFEVEEFNIGGKHIPLGELPHKVSELDNLKSEEIIVYCRSGNRSGQAKMFLQDAGFNNVKNLTGGMMAWQANFE